MKPPLVWGARRNEGRELSLGSSSSGLVGGLANDTWITVTSNDPFFKYIFLLFIADRVGHQYYDIDPLFYIYPLVMKHSYRKSQFLRTVNHLFLWAIFHSYVSLPEGIILINRAGHHVRSIYLSDISLHMIKMTIIMI